jgi:hypothetical protein
MIPCRHIVCDKLDADLMEIAENLHRSDLTALQRGKQVAEWTRLIERKRERDKPAQVGPVSEPNGGRGKAGGDREAARKIGITRQEIQRGKIIENISPEAEQAATVAKLDDVQSALLEIGKIDEPAEQIAKVAEIAAERQRKKAERKAKPSPPPITPITTPITPITSAQPEPAPTPIANPAPTSEPQLTSIEAADKHLIKALQAMRDYVRAIDPEKELPDEDGFDEEDRKREALGKERWLSLSDGRHLIELQDSIDRELLVLAKMSEDRWKAIRESSAELDANGIECVAEEPVNIFHQLFSTSEFAAREAINAGLQADEFLTQEMQCGPNRTVWRVILTPAEVEKRLKAA